MHAIYGVRQITKSAKRNDQCGARHDGWLSGRPSIPSCKQRDGRECRSRQAQQRHKLGGEIIPASGSQDSAALPYDARHILHRQRSFVGNFVAIVQQ